MTQYVDLTLVLAFWVSMGSQGCRYPHLTLFADITSKTSEGVEGVDDSTYLFQKKRISLLFQQYEEQDCQNIDTTDTQIAKYLISQPPRVSIGCRYSSEGFGKGIDETIPLWISRSEMGECSQVLTSLSKNFRLGGHYHEKNQLYQEDPGTSARGVIIPKSFYLAREIPSPEGTILNLKFIRSFNHEKSSNLIKKDNSKSELHLTPLQEVLVIVLEQVFRYVKLRSRSIHPHITYVLHALGLDGQERDVSDPLIDFQGLTYRDANRICKAIGKVLDNDKLGAEGLKTARHFLGFCKEYASRLSAHEQQNALGFGATKNKFVAEYGCILKASIGREQDLVDQPGNNINPPPLDGRCECCGKHISQLKPFRKSGHPYFGSFEGELLVKNFRPEGPYDAGAANALSAAQLFCLIVEHQYPRSRLWWQTHRVQEKGANLRRPGKRCGSIEAIWECRDCIVLDHEEYLKRLCQRQTEQSQALSWSYGGSSNCN